MLFLVLRPPFTFDARDRDGAQRQQDQHDVLERVDQRVEADHCALAPCALFVMLVMLTSMSRLITLTALRQSGAVYPALGFWVPFTALLEAESEVRGSSRAVPGETHTDDLALNSKPFSKIFRKFFRAPSTSYEVQHRAKFLDNCPAVS